MRPAPAWTVLSSASKPGKTEDAWVETLEAAQSGLEAFCKPERVYALGLNDQAGHNAWPAYLTAYGAYHDAGRNDDEIYIKGDDPAVVETEARKWVSDWQDRAKKHLSEEDAG